MRYGKRGVNLQIFHSSFAEKKKKKKAPNKLTKFGKFPEDRVQTAGDRNIFQEPKTTTKNCLSDSFGDIIMYICLHDC